MNKKYIYSIIFMLLIGFASIETYAGNPDRTGQAGASELLINPWGRSSGWNSANNASIRGLESERVNVAGLAFTSKTEVLLTRTTWLSGSDIFLNTIGVAQRVGDASVIGLSLMAFEFGDQSITRDNNPDGGLGNFSPQFMNLGMSYAREFSNRIYGGITLRIISEAISDVRATGVALDAGIQYVTGKEDQFKFGIALRNVGTPMKFSGDGLAVRGEVLDDVDKIGLTINQRSERFDLPSLMMIGLSYDFLLPADQKIVAAFNFTSNSFTKDQYGVGLEYQFKEYFMARASYNYEEGINTDIGEERTNLNKGLAAGASFSVPFGKGDTKLGIDYSYRPTNPFNGTHVFGLRVAL